MFDECACVHMCVLCVRLCVYLQALKKSINGIVNKVNTVNIKNMLAEVFREVRTVAHTHTHRHATGTGAALPRDAILACVYVCTQNLIRGRGLFCRSMMKSQLASPTFSPVYAGT